MLPLLSWMVLSELLGDIVLYFEIFINFDNDFNFTCTSNEPYLPGRASVILFAACF